MSLLRRLAAIALAAGLGTVSGCASITGTPNTGYQAGDGSFTVWEPNQRAEPVVAAGITYAGDAVDLVDLRGGVVVMNFWYAGCPPCRAEAPDLAAIDRDYPEITMLGVNPRDNAGTAQAFERTFAVPYPSINDSDAAVIAAMQGTVPLQAMPTTIVLDTEGRVAARILGQADPQILRGLIDDVVGE